LKAALTTFLQKLSWKSQRPLVLKSPTHTCRIKLLLELFPDAKFIHIRRHPFEVFRSMKKMLAIALRFWQLQKGDRIDWEERTIRQYREMYEAYFEERSLIPEGRLHEVSFEDLEADPMGQVRAVYQALRLPDFAVFEPAVRRFPEGLSEEPAERASACHSRAAGRGMAVLFRGLGLFRPITGRFSPLSIASRQSVSRRLAANGPTGSQRLSTSPPRSQDRSLSRPS
jgi:hypothetical protein